MLAGGLYLDLIPLFDVSKSHMYRIYIECAFGELVMRWGIFWRTLMFELPKKTTKIIQVCMLLHNFIIDHDREGTRSYSQDISMDSMQLLVEITR
jgi:Plant transposon protein